MLVDRGEHADACSQPIVNVKVAAGADRHELGTAGFVTAPTGARESQEVTDGVQAELLERWVQTCRRELLDRTLIWNQRHLLQALREFEKFYNSHRQH
ncbi:hypothetical protein [Saccharopolyspora shandongensis]|uniref:hypothetical protein n=1 Tax=Saccharopolyspora shandongensis TaxID=418495 RepID=UPI003406E244